MKPSKEINSRKTRGNRILTYQVSGFCTTRWLILYCVCSQNCYLLHNSALSIWSFVDIGVFVVFLSFFNARMYGTDLSILYELIFSNKLIKTVGYLIVLQIPCK